MLKIEGLETLQVPGEKDGPAIVLLHGYGADSNDLFPIANFLQIGKKFHWYLPNAPLPIPLSPFSTGRAWFPLGQQDFDLFTSGKTDEISSHTYVQFQKAAQMVDDLIQQVAPFHSRIILGGFSQGP